MKGTQATIAALICLSGCANCGDDTAGNNDNNETPDVCTPEFQYEDWNISEDRRLVAACSPYILDTSAEITEGAKMTVDPGVTILVGTDEWIRIQSGSIVANGTAEDPIIFSSSQSSPLPGSWLGLRFGADTEGTEISHAIIEYGGADRFSTEGCLTIESGVQRGRVKLTDTTFANCGKSGLASPNDVFTELSGLKFVDNPDFGMSLGAAALGQVAASFEYENTPANQITANKVEETATWQAQDVPYRAIGSIEVGGEADPVLTLAPGLTIQFDGGDWLRIGSAGNGGIIAQGTETEPITLESAAGTKAAGDWLGMRIENNLLTGSVLEHLILRHGGEDGFSQSGCLTILSGGQNRLSVRNSTFEDCAQSGVSNTDADFAFAEFTDNTFVNSDAGMDLRASAVGSVGSQNYEGTDRNRMNGGAVVRDASWVAQDVPWRVRDSIEVGGDDAPVLTIESGVELQFESNEWLRVGANEGTLMVQGEDGNPVIFRGTSEGAGSWLGIRLEGDIGNGSVIDNALIEHAGQDGFSTLGCVTILGSTSGRVSITNSTFNQCEKSGIGVADDDFEFEAVTSNTFKDSDIGLRLPPGAIGGVTDSQTYESVPANQIEGARVKKTATWVKQDVPWSVVGSIELGDEVGTPTLTIEAGNVLGFSASEWLRVGGSGVGTLVANGTASDPVTFTSRQATGSAGDWIGLRFERDTGSGTTIDNAVVEFGGDARFSQKGGAHIQDTGTAVTITNSVFRDNAQADIWIDRDSTPTLSGNTAATVVNE